MYNPELTWDVLIPFIVTATALTLGGKERKKQPHVCDLDLVMTLLDSCASGMREIGLSFCFVDLQKLR